jgi:hypothetical protein
MENVMDDKKEKSEILKGLDPVDPAVLAAFEREMTEKVIPEIREVVEERRELAAKSRQWQLKT